MSKKKLSSNSVPGGFEFPTPYGVFTVQKEIDHIFWKQGPLLVAQS